MPRHPHATLDWGTLETAYTDEFGRVAPDVFAAAGRLWQQAQAYASHILPDNDPALIRTLLIKSAARVTRAREEQSQPITELDGYLFQTFKHVVLAALEKDNNRLRFETEAEINAELHGQIDNVERRILLNEIVAAMDEWTREVYEGLTLGYTFTEIGRQIGLSGKALSNKFRRRIESLMEQNKDRSSLDG
jgi:hypothetical protein